MKIRINLNHFASLRMRFKPGRNVRFWHSEKDQEFVLVCGLDKLCRKINKTYNIFYILKV